MKNDYIRIRCTKEEKKAVKERALREGYANMTDYILEKIGACTNEKRNDTERVNSR